MILKIEDKTIQLLEPYSGENPTTLRFEPDQLDAGAFFEGKQTVNFEIFEGDNLLLGYEANDIIDVIFTVESEPFPEYDHDGNEIVPETPVMVRPPHWKVVLGKKEDVNLAEPIQKGFMRIHDILVGKS